jgi:hypothetical protein
MKEATSTSETSLDFYQNIPCDNTNAAFFIFAASRT